MAADTRFDGADNDTQAHSGDAQSADWALLKESRDIKASTLAWLQVQARLIGPDTRCGIVVFGAPDQGPYAPTAIWPEGAIGGPVLAEAVEAAVAGRRSVIKNGKRIASEHPPKAHAVACPLLIDGQLCGAVAFEVGHLTEEKLHQLMQQMEWGLGWLGINVHRNRHTSSDRLVAVLELIATSLHHDRFQASATAVATELAGLLGCERVAIGFLRGKHAQVRALSHSASFGRKGNLIRAIEAAMDEAIDQHATVVYPALGDGALQVTRAHAALARQQDDGSVCTIPLTEGGRLLGAMVLERPGGEAFDERTIQLCEHAASLIGPLLDIKRKDDRWLPGKMADSGRALLKKLFGPRHTGLKLASLATLAIVVFFMFAESGYRISADANLEGTVQRAVAVPVSGYVLEANVRAGDVVKAGDLLFSLDDRDLRLERLKRASQKLQVRREYNEAAADHDRAKARILTAQIEQTDAEIALLDEQIKRTRVTAPFDGFVVSGDLSQSLGAPVERGDVLFELAPLNSYRVILRIDERDIDAIAVNQKGQLALASSPEELLPFSVTKITPLSTAEQGQNYFRVEASLDGDIPPRLRPGMEGVGKVDIAQRKLAWIWSHRITHWLQMFFWSWWP